MMISISFPYVNTFLVDHDRVDEDQRNRGFLSKLPCINILLVDHHDKVGGGKRM